MGCCRNATRWRSNANQPPCPANFEKDPRQRILHVHNCTTNHARCFLLTFWPSKNRHTTRDLFIITLSHSSKRFCVFSVSVWWIFPDTLDAGYVHVSGDLVRERFPEMEFDSSTLVIPQHNRNANCSYFNSFLFLLANRTENSCEIFSSTSFTSDSTHAFVS